jgi:GTP-binding protein YchF
MRFGIIGLPQSGKTTIFNALTQGDAPVTVSGGRIEVRTAIVDVPDERVDRLVDLFQPVKTTFARVTYADIAGLEGNDGKNGNGNGKRGISGQLLNQLSQMDGFIHVVRCFENVSVPHSSGSLDPGWDISAMDGELALNDLIAVERKLEKLADDKKRKTGREKVQIEKETLLFERFQEALVNNILLRDLEIDPEEEKLLVGYGLLTLKPVLVILNLGDGQEPPDVAYLHRRSAVLSLQGRLEMDLSRLAPEEVQQFMTEFEIEELGLARVIAQSYELLGLHSFFTVGEDEVRAWTVRRGSSAWEAAGAIHTDLQKGFIRAEVVEHETLLSLGGLSEARACGRLRLEGKEYIVNDGEIMHVRFNL